MRARGKSMNGRENLEINVFKFINLVFDLKIFLSILTSVNTGSSYF